MKGGVLVLGLACAAMASVSARAQVTLDVAKITCHQFMTYKIAAPKLIAVWLSGYYHGKRGDTTLDIQELDAKAKAMHDYCAKNPDALMMQAVESVIGAGQ